MNDIKSVIITGVPCGLRFLNQSSFLFDVEAPTKRVRLRISTRINEEEKVFMSEQVKLVRQKDKAEMVLWVNVVSVMGRDPKGLSNLTSEEWTLIHDTLRIWLTLVMNQETSLNILHYVSPKGKRHRFIPPLGPEGYSITNPDAFSLN